MKKILATMLSLALLASTFVVASADGNPYATATAKPVSADIYNAVMEGAGYDALPEGASAYEVTLDLNNLPDLLWGNLAGATGVRFGSSTFDIYFDDLSNVASVFALGSDMVEYELGAEKYGKVAYAASVNNIKGAVSVVYTTTGGAKEAYPSKKADQDNDVDGALTDAIVLYVVTTAPVKIESIASDITIYNKGTAENTQETKSDLNVALGSTAPTTETKYFAASFVPGIKSAANNAIEFSFKDGDKEGKKAVYYGDVVMENLESVVTAVEVTEVPEKSALELVGTAWTTIVK